MAVPTGDYEAQVTLKLSPAFEDLSATSAVHIEQPPPDVFDRLLASFAEAGESERLRIMQQFPYFPEEGGRIVPALVECLETTAPALRAGALNAMMSFPEQAAVHTNRVLRLALTGPLEVRMPAIYFLGLAGRPSSAVEKVLARIRDEFGVDREFLGEFAEQALSWLRMRRGGEER